MSIFQSSILSKASAFGDAVALLDRASGISVRYSALEEFLHARLKGIPLDECRPFATWAASDFSHAALLLAVLGRDRMVAPLAHRLPLAEALRRAEWVGADRCWTEDGFHCLSPQACLVDASAAGTLLFTSGSSGMARAVWHGLASHIANAAGATRRIPLQPGCGWLLSLPLNHVSGFSVLIRCLLAGATVVFPDRRECFKNQIADPAVTHVSLVAVQLRRLLAEGASFRHLQAVLAGGGPIEHALADRALRAGVPLHITYGMTETASQIATTSRLRSLGEEISPGEVLPGRELRISETGEIQVRGDILPRGILPSRGLVPAVDGEGWFSTGDAGFFDAQRQLTIRGRLNRMFISGGENIYPEFIESLLASMPEVRRVVVVGVPDAEFGARPVAFVAGHAEPRTMEEFLKSRAEGFLVPDLFLPWPGDVSEDDAKLNFDYFSRLAREARH